MKSKTVVDKNKYNEGDMIGLEPNEFFLDLETKQNINKFKIFSLTKKTIEEYNKKVFFDIDKDYSKLMTLMKDGRKSSSIKNKSYKKMTKNILKIVNDDFDKMGDFLKKNYSKSSREMIDKVLSKTNFIRLNMEKYMSNVLTLKNLLKKSGYKTMEEIKEDKKKYDKELYVYLKHLIDSKRINLKSTDYSSINKKDFDDVNLFIEFLDFVNINTNICNLEKKEWYCSSSFDTFFDSHRRLGEPSVNGLVLKTKIKNTNKYVVIKTGVYSNYKEILDIDVLLYEYLIQRSMNPISKHCPNFIMSYGFFSCPASFSMKKYINMTKKNPKNILQPQINNLCEPFHKNIKNKKKINDQDNERNYLMSEYVPSNKTFYNIFLNPGDENYSKNIFSSLLQISCALIFAYNKYGFVHRDLHFNNILMIDAPLFFREHPEENIKHLFSYKFKSGKSIMFNAPYVCKIIDYGRSLTNNSIKKNTPEYKSLSKWLKTFNLKKYEKKKYTLHNFLYYEVKRILKSKKPKQVLKDYHVGELYQLWRGSLDESIMSNDMAEDFYNILESIETEEDFFGQDEGYDFPRFTVSGEEFLQLMVRLLKKHNVMPSDFLRHTDKSEIKRHIFRE